MNFIESILPNAASIPDEFLEATIETLYMTLWTAGLGFVLGLGLGVWLVLTQPKGLKANAAVYGVLDKFVNIFRSIPFLTCEYHKINCGYFNRYNCSNRAISRSYCAILCSSDSKCLG